MVQVLSVWYLKLGTVGDNKMSHSLIENQFPNDVLFCVCPSIGFCGVSEEVDIVGNSIWLGIRKPADEYPLAGVENVLGSLVT